MARYKFIVMANSKPGREEDYRQWYAQRHMPDVLDVPGFVSCEQLEHVGLDGRWLFSNLYDIETDDLDATMAEVFARAGTDRMQMSDAVDDDSLFTGVFKPR
jgi:hypothetical protein